MPKGEKIRPKQEMDQLPLEKLRNLKIVELEFLFVKILLFVSYCQNIDLLRGEGLIMGKRGSF
jgi:hypothetical protein